MNTNEKKYIKQSLYKSSYHYREVILNILNHILPTPQFKKIRKLLYTPKLYFRDMRFLKKIIMTNSYFKQFVFNIMSRFVPVSGHKKLRKFIFTPKLFFQDMWLKKRGLLPNSNSKKLSNVAKNSKKLSNVAKNVENRQYNIDNINFFYTHKKNLCLNDAPLIIYWGKEDISGLLSEIFKSYNFILPKKSSTWSQCWYDLSKLITVGVQNITFLFINDISFEVKEFAHQYKINIWNLSEGFLGGYPYPRGHFLSYFHNKDTNDNLDTETPFSKEKVSSLIKVIQDLEVTQIPTSLVPNYESIDINQGVLILGSKQQDNIWDINELALLAAQEYPQKILFLLPYAGNTSHINAERLKKNNIKYIPITSFYNFAQLLKRSVHVYTYDSPLGFDALIYGCSLTVLGTPFYAGYGLCDDRVSNIYRSSKKSLEELFYDLYICKQQYVNNTGNRYVDCFTAIVHTKFNNLQSSYELANKLSAKQYTKIVNSIFSICLFSPKHLKNAYNEFKNNIFNILPFETFFLKKDIEIQYILGCYIFGQLKDLIFTPFLLSNLQKFMHKEAYQKLENTIKRLNYSDNYELNTELNEIKFNFKSSNPKICNIKKTSNNDYTPVTPTTYQNTYIEAFGNFQKRELESSWVQLINIVLSGCEVQKSLSLLGDVYRISCDVYRAKELFNVNISFDEGWKNKSLLLRYVECSLLVQDFKEAFIYLVLYSGISQSLLPIVPYIDVLNKQYNIYRCREGFVNMYCHVGDKGTLNHAESYLNNRMPEKAYALLKNYTPDKSTLNSYLKTYGRTLLICGKINPSYEVFNKFLELNPNREAFNYVLFCSANSFEDKYFLNEVFKKSLSYNIDVDDSVKFRVATVNHLIREAFYYYARGVFSNWKKKIPEDKFVFAPEISYSKSTLILLGDSIGEPLFFGGQLGNLMKYYRQQIIFVGDARLEPLFRRTYKDIKYIPTSKMHRYVTEITSIDFFDKIPRIDLSNAITNEVMDYWHTADNISFIYGAFHQMLTSYSELPKNTFLQCDNDKVSYWKNKLKNISIIKVGICWRSFRETIDNKSYEFSIEDLSPLFENENIQLINLQYTGLNEHERDFIEQNFPKKLITLEEIDLLNDIDGSAAMIKSLDAVVSIPNSIGTLSSSVGIDTYITLISHPGYFVSDDFSDHSYFLDKAKLIYPDDFTCNKLNIISRIAKDIELSFTRKRKKITQIN